MSLIKPDTYKETETRYVSLSGGIGRQIEIHYVQYYRGIPVARFKCYEPKKKFNLPKISVNDLRKMVP